MLARGGWSPTTFAAGEELTIEYWPLLDGRTGGHFRLATRVDGSVIRGAGGPRGVDGNLPPGGRAVNAAGSRIPALRCALRVALACWRARRGCRGRGATERDAAEPARLERVVGPSRAVARRVAPESAAAEARGRRGARRWP